MLEIEIHHDAKVYIGAPVDTNRRRGRRRETASCGHPVWVDRSWYRAKAEGKRLVCHDCMQAVVAEHGHLLMVYQRSEK